jgi:hypothetical protein
MEVQAHREAAEAAEAHARQSSRRSIKVKSFRSKKSVREKSERASRKASTRRAGAPIQEAYAERSTTTEKLRRIATRAAELENSQVKSGSVVPVDGTAGLFIVDGVYINREGSLAHTAV